MNGPYCRHQNRLEIDLRSDGYSADLLECTSCGAPLKLKRTSLETVHGSVHLFGALLAQTTSP